MNEETEFLYFYTAPSGDNCVTSNEILAHSRAKEGSSIIVKQIN
tara:strand:- start:954 stop:1085 length:132 start_codon:yes stop_codon:yes gene_type:complete